MFGFFRPKAKKFAASPQEAVAVIHAVTCWKASVYEVALNYEGMRLSGSNIMVWAEVANRFIGTIMELDPLSADDKAEIEIRMNMYLSFVQDQVLENNYLFTQEELEQIGEFIAIASICGIVIAIISDIERASLIHDLLPKEWLLKAGLNPDKFDDTYFSTTGKRRKHRETTG